MCARTSTRVAFWLLVTALVVPLAAAMPAEMGAKSRTKTKTITRIFLNIGLVAIPGTGDQGTAVPYPAIIHTYGFKRGTITDVNVTLFDVHHTFPDNVDIMLAADQMPGRNATIMSDVGGDTDTSGDFTVGLDDQAMQLLPDDGPLVPATFQPRNAGE